MALRKMPHEMKLAYELDGDIAFAVFLCFPISHTTQLTRQRWLETQLSFLVIASLF
jgi:hypothetical protein